MIHIEKGQKISENDGIAVFSPTGDYNVMDQVEFYVLSNPEVALGAFQAQFVKYGSLVYRFNDPRELGTEILKIDPESTHSAASYVRMSNELLKQMNAGSLEPESLNNALQSEQEMMEEKMEETVPQETTPTNTEPQETNPFENLTSTSTPAVAQQATTTPSFSDQISTTTSPIVFQTSTTTPMVAEVSTSTPSSVETATSTPAVHPEPTATSTAAVIDAVNTIKTATDDIATTTNTITKVIESIAETVVPVSTSTTP